MSMTVNDRRKNDDSELARLAVVSVRRALDVDGSDDHHKSLSVEGGDAPVTVPREAVELLVSVLANMAAGQSVSIVPLYAELTTQQAAEILNVSRPFLIKLLDEGMIEYKLVGTHRRIRANSLMRYKRRDDERGRHEAAELIRLSQEMDIAQ